MQDQVMELYDAEGKAVWFQHTRKNDIDVAVINVGTLLSNRYRSTSINDVATQNDMRVEIGNEVFILGYPLGFTHFINAPIWKRGSIASEPNLETPVTKFRVVIDATTRQGMSGGPVIMRAKTHYVSESGQITAHINATRWIGINASRPDLPAASGANDDDRRAEIGFFYKAGSVIEVIREGVRGPDFGSLP
jgi:Trypsin-like peptidase domain